MVEALPPQCNRPGHGHLCAVSLPLENPGSVYAAIVLYLESPDLVRLAAPIAGPRANGRETGCIPDLRGAKFSRSALKRQGRRCFEVRLIPSDAVIGVTVDLDQDALPAKGAETSERGTSGACGRDAGGGCVDGFVVVPGYIYPAGLSGLPQRVQRAAH